MKEAGACRAAERVGRRRVYAVSMKSSPMPGARCKGPTQAQGSRSARPLGDGGGEATPAAGGVEKHIKKKKEKKERKGKEMEWAGPSQPTMITKSIVQSPNSLAVGSFLRQPGLAASPTKHQSRGPTTTVDEEAR